MTALVRVAIYYFWGSYFFTVANFAWLCHLMVPGLAKIYGVKTLFVVAPATGVAELSVMNIVLAMTVDASPVFLAGLILPGSGVTGMAMNISMGIPEPERGFVMIEIPDQPGA